MITKDDIKESYTLTRGEDQDLVTIGDPKNLSTFKPIITLSRWNNEEKLGIESKIFSFDDLSLSSGELKIEDASYEFYFKGDGADNLKFGLVLKKKPTSNHFQLELTGWQNFDFFYIPYLKNVDPDGFSWELNERGGLRRSRNSGGYAVYHKTKKNHILGETNYRCGKFGDFRPPLFRDAVGAMAWGSLYIEDGIYTITAPQKFLDTAKYPVIANDTFGYTDTGNEDDWNDAPYYYQLENLSPADGGTMTQLSIAFQPGGANTATRFGMYSDSSTTPNTQLVQDASTWTPGSTDAKFYTRDLGYALGNSTQYWAAYAHAAASYVMYETTDGASKGMWEGTASGSTLPATADGRSSLASKRMPAYVTYTPAAAGGATVTPTTGSLAFSGKALFASMTLNTLTLDALALTGKNLNPNLIITQTTAKGALALSGKTLFNYLNITQIIPKVALALTGLTIKANNLLTSATATLTLAGKSFIATLGIILVVAKGTLTLTGFKTVANNLLTLAVGALTLTGKTLLASAGVIIQIAKGVLALTGKTLTSYLNITQTIAKGALTLTGKGLLTFVAKTVIIAKGTLTLATKAFSIITSSAIVRRGLSRLGISSRLQ